MVGRKLIIRNFLSVGLFAAFMLIGAMSLQAQVGVVNGLTQEKTVKTGESYRGIIILKNTGHQDEEMRFYQTDYFFNCEGKSFYDAPGKLGRSNAAWITINPKRLTVAPNGQAEVRYTVNVPAQEPLIGTYWSMIMVETVPRVQPVKSDAETKQVTFGVNQVMRYGVQIVNHIGDSGTSKIKFINTELIEENNQRTLRMDVENVGERWLRPFSYVELYNDKGELAAKVEGDRWRMFPGTSQRFVFDLTKLPAGKYRALVVLDNKDANVFGAQYTLSFAKVDPISQAGR